MAESVFLSTIYSSAIIKYEKTTELGLVLSNDEPISGSSFIRAKEINLIIDFCDVVINDSASLQKLTIINYLFIYYLLFAFQMRYRLYPYINMSIKPEQLAQLVFLHKNFQSLKC